MKIANFVHNKPSEIDHADKSNHYELPSLEMCKIPRCKNTAGWGESGKVILQVSIAVFSGAVEKIFGQGWLSPSTPLEKIGQYAYAVNRCIFVYSKNIQRKFHPDLI